jgi:hypothetical protein
MENDFVYPESLDLGVQSGGGFSGIPDSYGSLFRSKSPMRAIQEALEKSLTAGYETNLPSMTGGGAMRIESLEPNLTSLIYDDKSTALFNDLLATKQKAKSTIEQYTTWDYVGEAATFEEGGAPSYEDDGYTRHVMPVKYVGAIGKVTNPMREVESIVEPEAQETRAKMLAIKRKANQVCYFGNATAVPTEWNGLYTSVLNGAYAATNIIDLQGKRPTLENFNQAIAAMEGQKGYLTSPRVYISPSARMNYKNELLKNKYYIINGQQQTREQVENAIQGLGKNEIAYDGGEMPYRKDIFLDPKKYPRRNVAGNAFVATGSTPPLTPTITSITPTNDATSSIPAADYNYAVVAVNKYGQKSAPAESGSVTIADGQSAVFVLADSGSTTGLEATAWEIYRRAAGGAATDYRYLFTAAVASTPITDKNAYMPNTSIIPIVDFDTSEVLRYHQLLDAAKFPLATTVDAIQWLQRLYGVMIVKNTQRIVILINAGSTPAS